MSTGENSLSMRTQRMSAESSLPNTYLTVKWSKTSLQRFISPTLGSTEKKENIFFLAGKSNDMVHYAVFVN